MNAACGGVSVGVNLLYALARRATAVLGREYDAEVIETHHRYRKDALSGTASGVAEIIREERRLENVIIRHGRRRWRADRVRNRRACTPRR
jgi:4-hydroxy-tetrahydrodipicolinate reductase